MEAQKKCKCLRSDFVSQCALLLLLSIGTLDKYVDLNFKRTTGAFAMVEVKSMLECFQLCKYVVPGELNFTLQIQTSSAHSQIAKP